MDFLNIWSFLLAAALSQALLLIIFLSLRPAGNNYARGTLIGLLTVVFFILFSNFWKASGLYHKVYWLTEMGHGMVLLLGPLLYFYALAIITPGFKLKPGFFVHLIPYAAAVVYNLLQVLAIDKSNFINAVSSVLAGTTRVSLLSLCMFSVYFIHLSFYLVASRKKANDASEAGHSTYLVPYDLRKGWLQKITAIYYCITLTFAGVLAYMVLTGFYTAGGNFIYCMLLSLLVYFIVYQALADVRLLKPDFERKYQNINQDNEIEDAALSKILELFNIGKVYLDPDIRLAAIAKGTGASVHRISKVINNKLGKSFTELVATYRIEEVKLRLKDPAYSNYSIYGVAMDVGFTSKSAFNAVFKKHVGVTPSQFMSESLHAG